MIKPEKGQVLIYSSAGRLRLASESFDYRAAIAKVKELEESETVQQMKDIAEELSDGTGQLNLGLG